VLQILVVDNNHSQLVTCGTVFQGTCQSRNLLNISLYEINVIPKINYAFVSSTDPSAPAVAFLAPGPSKSIRLYVGTDKGLQSPVLYSTRKYTYGVSSRQLTKADAFQISVPNDDRRGTFAHLSEAAAKSSDFLMKYITGFSAEGFSYFFTNQPEVYPANSNTPTVSKISQVCQKDPLFDSYAEMQITCQSDSKNYDLLQAATLLQPNTKLGQRLGIAATEHLLVAAFYGNPDSALCIYRLSDIRRQFTENIQACYNSSSLLVGRQFEFEEMRYCTSNPQVRKRTFHRWLQIRN